MALTQYLLQQFHITALRRLQHRRPLAHLSCSLCTRLTTPVLLRGSARNVPTALGVARTERGVLCSQVHRESAPLPTATGTLTHSRTLFSGLRKTTPAHEGRMKKGRITSVSGLALRTLLRNVRNAKPAENISAPVPPSALRTLTAGAHVSSCRHCLREMTRSFKPSSAITLFFRTYKRSHWRLSPVPHTTGV